MTEATAIKETKAQRAERLKRALNPWEAYEAIVRFARDGRDTIPPEWNTYFRWWGVYTQGDGAGVTGGSGGEGKSVPYFMVRLRIPNGILDAAQARSVAALAERHGRGIVDMTVRQNVQLHWVTLEALPDVLESLRAAGLTTMGACGDVVRNVTGCPLAGVDADELIDASPLVAEVTALLNGHPAFYNLPRKFKVSIAGCRAWCAYPEINDVGLTAVRHPRSGEVGFSLRVGGGLSTDPHLARRLDAFVRPGEVAAVVRGVAEVFRDTDVLREHREKARLKFLFLQHGWTAARFQDALERRLGFALLPGVPEAPPREGVRDHLGVRPERHDGFYSVGVPVLRGRLRAGQLRAIADAAERHASGRLRATAMQNLLVLDVPSDGLAGVVRASAAAGLPLGVSTFARGTVACTGTEFCKLALTETKGFAERLVAELQARLPGFDEHVAIHVTGCPNSCGQHWIADIGLEGKKLKVDGRLVDAYYFCVGGAAGGHAAIARPVGYRVPAPDVAPAIERLVRAYLAHRLPGERFRAFCARHDDVVLRALLAGAELPAVERDPSPGPAPHVLES
ncbi:MAG: nitrite/sulfite reductase [Candidatus Rokubacteria bacterium]|nr:nitrite/sulfite reductase [Candidatus Rokubacteria bacterium]